MWILAFELETSHREVTEVVEEDIVEHERRFLKLFVLLDNLGISTFEEEAEEVTSLSQPDTTLFRGTKYPEESEEAEGAFLLLVFVRADLEGTDAVAAEKAEDGEWVGMVVRGVFWASTSTKA